MRISSRRAGLLASMRKIVLHYEAASKICVADRNEKEKYFTVIRRR